MISRSTDQQRDEKPNPRLLQHLFGTFIVPPPPPHQIVTLTLALLVPIRTPGSRAAKAARRIRRTASSGFQIYCWFLASGVWGHGSAIWGFGFRG